MQSKFYKEFNPNPLGKEVGDCQIRALCAVTGKMCVIKDEAVKQFTSPQMFEQVQKSRVAFIEDAVWEKLN